MSTLPDQKLVTRLTKDSSCLARSSPIIPATISPVARCGMDSSPLLRLPDMEPIPGSEVLRVPAPPSKVIPRSHPRAPRQDESIELQSIIMPPRSGDSGTATPGDVEMNGPTTVIGPAGTEALKSILDPYKNRFRFASVCLMNFLNGLNDSAPGALIPHLER